VIATFKGFEEVFSVEKGTYSHHYEALHSKKLCSVSGLVFRQT